MLQSIVEVTDAAGNSAWSNVSMIIEPFESFCLNQLEAEGETVALSKAVLLDGLDSALGTDQNTRNSECALELYNINENGNEPFARYQTSLSLQNFGSLFIIAGDYVRVGLSGKSDTNSARFEVTSDLEGAAPLISQDFTSDWQDISVVFQVPEDATFLDFAFYTNYQSTVDGHAVFDNFVVEKLSGCGNETRYYLDADGDGYGDPSQEILSCVALENYVTNNLDCNDNEANAFPGNVEICDGIDNDCDGEIDEEVCENSCPNYFTNESNTIAFSGYEIRGLDASEGTTDAFESECAIQLTETDRKKYARLVTTIDVAENNLEAGDELRIRVDAKALENSAAHIDVVANNEASQIIETHAFANGNQWSRFNKVITVPADATTIDIWLYADYGRGNGSSIYDNLFVRNLSNCDVPTTWYADVDGDGFGDPQGESNLL